MEQHVLTRSWVRHPVLAWLLLVSQQPDGRLAATAGALQPAALRRLLQTCTPQAKVWAEYTSSDAHLGGRQAAVDALIGE